MSFFECEAHVVYGGCLLGFVGEVDVVELDGVDVFDFCISCLFLWGDAEDFVEGFHACACLLVVACDFA